MNNATKFNGLVSGPSLTVPINISAATTSGQVVSVRNPEAVPIIIDRVKLLIQGDANQAGTVSIGTAATSTSSANLIDTLSVASTPNNTLYDNFDNGGTLGKSKQYMAAGDYLTVSVASGDLNGLVAQLMVDYQLIAGGSLV